MVTGSGAGVLHDVGLLVGTAASVAEADASANRPGLQGATGAGYLAWRTGPATLGGMSDPSLSAGDPALSGHPSYDRPPRQALDEMPVEVRAAWRNRYLAEAEAELRVQALLDRAEAALRSTGTPPTIRTLWISLADRAGKSGDADLRAAAALAGMAMGLRPS